MGSVSDRKSRTVAVWSQNGQPSGSAGEAGPARARPGRRSAGRRASRWPGARSARRGCRPSRPPAASRALGGWAPSRRSRAGRPRHECRGALRRRRDRRDTRGAMTPVVPARPLLVAIVLAALACGGIVIALELVSDHQDMKAVWADLRPGGGLELHRHRPLRVAAAAREPDRRAHDPAGLRVVAVHPGGGELAAGLHRRRWSPAACGAAVFLHLGVSFPTGRLSDPAGPHARDRRLLRLPAGLRARAAVRRPARARLRRLPDQPAAGAPRRRRGGGAHGLRRPVLPRALRRRARVGGAALAGHAAASTASSSRRSTPSRCSPSCS